MANKTCPEHSSSSKKFTKITIAEVEKAIGTQLDKYTVEAIEQMIRDNYIPDVLFASKTLTVHGIMHKLHDSDG